MAMTSPVPPAAVELSAPIVPVPARVGEIPGGLVTAVRLETGAAAPCILHGRHRRVARGREVGSLAPTGRRVAVYCASSRKCAPEYHAAARRLGEVLADGGFTVVYGGGAVGSMGALADGALARGGRVVG